MLTTLLALTAMQGGGAPAYGFIKADCILKKILGTPSIEFQTPALVGETELYETVYLKTDSNEEGECPRWVKVRGVKTSTLNRTVKVYIEQSVETATTLQGQYDVYRVQARYPSLFVDVKTSGWGVHVSEVKEYTFPLPAGASTAKFKCDTSWLKGALGGHPDSSANATLRSWVKKVELLTP